MVSSRLGAPPPPPASCAPLHATHCFAGAEESQPPGSCGLSLQPSAPPRPARASPRPTAFQCLFFPARPRRRAHHPSPSPSAGRCGARGAAPCKHRGTRLGCGRATPRVRATRHPLLGREPGICISQSLAAGAGRGSGCGAGRSPGRDWGCRMRSVSFLRQGTRGRLGNAECASHLAPKACLRPKLLLKF